ncbi:MAG: hypothetical protein JXB30_07860 [Anaerolineae bacterium]|nr:hypothetical protein [Anaerolineae bacterium]
MARVKKNVVMTGLSGMLGDQIVVKRDKAGRTIISIKPTFPDDREFSEEQLSQQEAFREAVMYAKMVKSEAVYTEKAEDTPRSGYNVAIADWFHAPEIEAIDLSGWAGQAGGSIRIKALDDVQVERVTVIITGEGDVLIEQGAAEQEDGLWWVYTTTQPATGQPRVIAIAQDLPGNIAQLAAEAGQEQEVV